VCVCGVSLASVRVVCPCVGEQASKQANARGAQVRVCCWRAEYTEEDGVGREAVRQARSRWEKDFEEAGG
jgi:hypothetical protein